MPLPVESKRSNASLTSAFYSSVSSTLWVLLDFAFFLLPSRRDLTPVSPISSEESFSVPIGLTVFLVCCRGSPWEAPYHFMTLIQINLNFKDKLSLHLRITIRPIVVDYFHITVVFAALLLFHSLEDSFVPAFYPCTVFFKNTVFSFRLRLHRLNLADQVVLFCLFLFLGQCSLH